MGRIDRESRRFRGTFPNAHVLREEQQFKIVEHAGYCSSTVGYCSSEDILNKLKSNIPEVNRTHY